MSFSPPNYTDGVPVKISERFKPPPEIHLPSKILNQLQKIKVPVAFEDDDYNFDLERKILSKTTEWINYRLKEKTERQQRIQERDILRQKRLEVEQKEKLNQVSYPSADELTSSCDEDENEPIADNIPDKNPFNSNFNSNTILMPTQAIATTAVPSSSSRKSSHRRYASNSSNKIDFSFFESDTSPFDHLEMKSMNEMEVLAQILKSTAVESDENTLERNNSSESENSEPRNNVNNNSDVDHQQPQATTVVQAIQEQPNYNSMYNNYYNYPTTGTQYYNNANYATPTHQHHQQHPQFYPASNNFYYTQNYAVNYSHVANNNATPMTTTTMENYLTSDKMENNSSKSKSVPDIVKELNDELNNSERRRIRNYSQNSHKVESEDHEANESKNLKLNLIELLI